MESGEDRQQRSESKRVLLLISNLEYGGAQRQLIELARNIDRTEFDVFICSLSKYMPLATEVEEAGMTVQVVEKKSKYDFSVVSRLVEVLRSNRIDIIHAFLFDAQIAARIAGWVARVPVVIGSERNTNYHVKRNQLVASTITKRLEDACIANSASGADFNGRIFRNPGSHYFVVHNGVDTQRFCQGSGRRIRNDLGIAEDCFVVGMFASMKPQKNHQMLIRAAVQLKQSHLPFKLLLMGEQLHGAAQNTDEYALAIRKSIVESALEEHVVRSGNKDEIEQFYRACDVTVLPSRFEGCPNVVLESMATGVPVIVTNVSDNSIIVEHGQSGYVLDVDDDAGLANCLTLLYEDPDLRLRMGERARLTVEKKFSCEVLARRTCDVYRKLYARKKK